MSSRQKSIGPRYHSGIIEEMKETISNIDLYAKRVELPNIVLHTIKKTINLQCFLTL